MLLTALSALAVALGAVTTPADTPKRDCVSDAVSGAEQCFSDYRAAIAFSTEGAIVDAPLNAHEAVNEPTFQAEVMKLATGVQPGLGGGSVRAGLSTGLPAAQASNPVIGATLFTGTNFSGASDTIRITKPCVKDGKYDYGLAIVKSMRNRIQSVQPWANCWIWLHSSFSWNGPRQGPYENDSPDLGDWKNRAVMIGLS